MVFIKIKTGLGRFERPTNGLGSAGGIIEIFLPFLPP